MAEDITKTESKGIIILCRRTDGKWHIMTGIAYGFSKEFCCGDDKTFFKSAKLLMYYPGVPILEGE